ncbi:MAG: outer membrane lipid asymmetry maintenance protein MlaD [Rhizobiales bacterium]|nr:outer membrane lipid asymmetry maintenance protein MlaD [Hyphomicrobiales bacterium]
MNRITLDLWVGVFVAIGLGALLFLALKVGNLSSANTGETYVLKANFDNIGGLKIRAPVKSAGVVVGRVGDIRLDAERFEAVVTMNIGTQFKFPRDTFAKIRTSGLLGEQYIGLAVGGDEQVFKSGDSVKKTESAMVLEDLVGQFLFNKAAEGNDKK